MNAKALALLLGVLAGLPLVGSVFAADVEPPSEPLPGEIDYGHWKIEVTPAFSAKSDKASAQAAEAPEPTPAGKKPTVIEVYKTGRTARVITTLPWGQSTEIWNYGGLAAAYTEKSQPPVLVSMSSKMVDFPECSWISVKNFSGIQKVLGRDCYVFRGRESRLTEGELNDAKAIAAKQGLSFDEEFFNYDVIACLDVTNKLPVVVRKDTDNFVYKFLTPPSAPLELPAEVLKLFQFEAQRIKDLQRKPAQS